jgi:hypothetical protein
LLKAYRSSRIYPVSPEELPCKEIKILDLISKDMKNPIDISVAYNIIGIA